MAMNNMGCAPPAIQDILRERSDTLGLPRIGTDDNYAYPTIQCNIASASKTCSDLSGDMGEFGSAHRDERDSVGHYTNMIANSKLPAGYDPGYFHILLLGVYVKLSSGIGLNFQGHWKHGGSSPSCPSGATLDPLATRFILVSYPPDGMLNNRVRHRIAEGSRPNLLQDASTYESPEAKNIMFDTSLITRSARRANFACDGHVLMEPQSYADFLSRTLYKQATFIANQSPSYIGVHIDPERFLSSISFIGKSGRENVKQWELAPLSRHGGGSTTATQRKISASEARWKQHIRKVAKVIPSKHSSALSSTEKDDNKGEIDNDHDQVMGEEGPELGQQARMEPPLPVNRASPHLPHSNSSEDEEERSSQDPFCVDPQVLRNKPKPKPTISDGMKKVLRTKTAKGVNTSLAKKSSKKNEKKAPKKSGTRSKAGSRRRRNDSGGEPEDEPEPSSRKRKGRTFAVVLPPTKRQRPIQDVDFKFISLLNSSNLENEIHDLRRAVGRNEDDGQCLAITSKIFITASQKLNKHPLDPGSLFTARIIANGLETMKGIHSGFQLATRMVRLQVINAQVQLWRWLDGVVHVSVVERLSGDLDGSLSDLSWLSRLTDSVRVFYTARTPAKTFDPADYGVTKGAEGECLKPYAMTNQHRKLEYLTDDKKLTNLVASSVVLIISSWIGEANELDQKRAWFVDAVAAHLGQEALTLDVTWKIFRNFKIADILPPDQTCSNFSDRSILDPFIKRIQSHPVTSPDSPEGALYALYCQLLSGEISSHEVLDPLLDLTPAWPQFKRMLALATEFLEDSDQDFQDPFQDALQEDEDFFLPMRNHAFSRLRSTSASGPYAKDTITTIQGLFSAVVWRACTYRSDFSKEAPMIFQDDLDFYKVVDGIILEKGGAITREDSYFCLKDAYGQPSGHRSIGHASAYWKSLQELDWEKLLGSYPTFTEVIEFFRPTNGPAAKRFPQLGPLGAFMLAGDLVEALVCQKPTDLETARYIVENGKGSLAGLKTLGLGPSDETRDRDERVEEVRHGLEELLTRVKPILLNLGYKEEELDFCLVEHMLCKFQRALDRGLLE